MSLKPLTGENIMQIFSIIPTKLNMHGFLNFLVDKCFVVFMVFFPAFFVENPDCVYGV